MSNQREVEMIALKIQILNSTNVPESSLCERELTLAEVRAMSAREYYFHSIYNSKNVELALSEPSRKQAGQEQLHKNEFRRFWNSAKEDTANRVQIAGNVAYEFQQLFPQMAAVEENTTAIVKLIQERGEVFSLQSVIAAYQTLCSQGQLWICPENCGLEGSELVRGKMLTSIRGWERVLEPVRMRRALLSAFVQHSWPAWEIKKRIKDREILHQILESVHKVDGGHYFRNI
jgi:hypothetical protein